MLVDDGNGNGTRGLEDDGIGRLTLTEQEFSVVRLLTLHVRGDAREIDRAAEFRLQPALEAMDRGRTNLVVHEQHVLAPLDRFVAAAEHLMHPGGSEKARSLETHAHAFA